ncbi:MAG TPA: hypothetical protein VHQ64_20025, partial [Pyrinomonadaceae bacterium]|nr:hypothetical protein [Pyrinomonadaceae bacterium]
PGRGRTDSENVVVGTLVDYQDQAAISLAAARNSTSAVCILVSPVAMMGTRFSPAATPHILV